MFKHASARVAIYAWLKFDLWKDLLTEYRGQESLYMVQPLDTSM